MEKHITDFINLQIKNKLFPGAVIYVTKDSSTLYQGAFGNASLFPAQLPMNNNTIFDIASLTKLVTTTIILKLINDNSFSLETKVVELLPKLSKNQLLENYFSNVDVKQLLTHSSGLLDWFPFYSNSTLFYEQLSAIISSTEKTDGVRYSDLNYMLAAEIIKEQTPYTLQEAVNHFIRTPLNMKTMTYGPIASKNVAATEFGNQIEQKMCAERNLSFSHWRENSQAICGEVNDGNAHYNFNGVSGHAGLFANAEDVSKIGELYSNQGQLEGVTYLAPSLCKTATTVQVGTRGLGWELSSLYPTGCGHTGFTGTSLWIDPERKLTVTILTNRLHTETPKNINDFRKTLHNTILSTFS